MEFFIVIFCAVAFVAAMIAAAVWGDKSAEKAAWKSGKRFVVRQVQNGVTVREWICARYHQTGEKIYFYQEGHTEVTYVAGQWHVEPVSAK